MDASRLRESTFLNLGLKFAYSYLIVPLNKEKVSSRGISLPATTVRNPIVDFLEHENHDIAITMSSSSRADSI